MIVALETASEPDKVGTDATSIINKVISTSDWGARNPRLQAGRTTPRFIVIHHTVTPNPPNDRGNDESGAKLLARSIQNDHMDNNGWIDSGYNFLNTTGGFTLEGRHGSLDNIKSGLCVRSAHAPGANDSPGIENEGDFRTFAMGDIQWNSLVDLCAAICQSCDIDPDNIKGHRDFVPTECPGDWLYGQLPRLRNEVRAKLG